MHAARTLLWILGLVFAAGMVASDPHTYVQGGLGDVGVVCGEPGIGGVCIEAFHIQKSGSTATVSVSDVGDVAGSRTSAWYCQSNGGVLCSATPFCQSLTLVEDINWIPSQPVYIDVHGPVWGNPVLGCSGDLVPTGTTGSVIHT